MKKIVSSAFLCWLFCAGVDGQKFWTGGGMAGQWNSAGNWSGNAVPMPTDDVILDNSHVGGTYTVTLPNTSITISIKSLQLTPSGTGNITLVIPTGNTANPGLSVTGTGYSLTINRNGILINSTGVGPGGIGLNIIDSFRINNDGHYIHNNTRANAAIVSQLAFLSGTEKGIFEYNVPSPSSFTISLSGRNYGTLILSSTAAGGNKPYTGNGAIDLNVHGDLIINSQTDLSSTLTANINIGGDLLLNGNFDNSPSPGTTNRSIIFNGVTNQTISGGGLLTFGPDFRNIRINKNSGVTLAKDISINQGDSLVVDTSGKLNLNTHRITGAGSFVNFALSSLSFGDPVGISFSGATGNVQTAIRTFDIRGNYEYNGTVAQITGTGLSSTMSQLVINNNSGVTLSSSAIISDSLSLLSGKLITGSNLLTLNANATVHSSASSYSNLLGMYPNNMGTDSSYVVGTIKKLALNNETFAFPVGNFYHRPIILKHATGDFEVTYVQQNPYTLTNGGIMDGILNHVSHIEYWNINSGGRANVELTFYDPNSGGVTDMNTLMVGQHDGSKWSSKGDTSLLGTAGLNGSVTGNMTLMTGLTPFTLASTTPQNPLPLYLKYFRLQLKALNNHIEWGIENDNEYNKYILERSFDGIVFDEVNKQLSKGMNSLTWYNYKDKVSFSCFYRLQLTLNTGKVFYSNILNAARNFYYTVYPNPANKEISIKFPAQSSVTSMEFVNNSGRVLKKIQTAASSITINVESLSKGMYLIRFRNQQQAISQRFIKE